MTTDTLAADARALAARCPEHADELAELARLVDNGHPNAAATQIRSITEAWGDRTIAAEGLRRSPKHTRLTDFNGYLNQTSLDRDEWSGALSEIAGLCNAASHAGHRISLRRLSRAFGSMRWLLELRPGRAEEAAAPARGLRRRTHRLQDAPLLPSGLALDPVVGEVVRDIFGQLLPETHPDEPPSSREVKTAWRVRRSEAPLGGPVLWEVTFLDSARLQEASALERCQIRVHPDAAAASEDLAQLVAIADQDGFDVEVLGRAPGHASVVVLIQSPEAPRAWLDEALAHAAGDEAARGVLDGLRGLARLLTASTIAADEARRMLPARAFLRGLLPLLPPDVVVDATTRKVSARGASSWDVADERDRLPGETFSASTIDADRLRSLLEDDLALDGGIEIALEVGGSAPGRAPGAWDLLGERSHLRIGMPASVVAPASTLGVGTLRFWLPDPELVSLQSDGAALGAMDLRAILGRVSGGVFVHRRHVLLSPGALALSEGRPVVLSVGCLADAPDALDAAILEVRLWCALAGLEGVQPDFVGGLMRHLERGSRPRSPFEARCCELIEAVRRGYSEARPGIAPQWSVAGLVAVVLLAEADGLPEASRIVMRALAESYRDEILGLPGPDEVAHAAPADGPTLAALWEAALRDVDGDLDMKARGLLDAMRQRDDGAFLDRALTALQGELYDRCVGEPAASDPFLSPHHIVLTGPTSSGKSTVADMFLVRNVLRQVEQRRCSLYIAPTKALAQAKHRELLDRLARRPSEPPGLLRERRILLSTADDTDHDIDIVHGNYDIACLVYEKANILFSRVAGALAQIGCMVVDELHMIVDKDRGPNLELALTKALTEAERAQSGVRERLKIVVISTEDAEHDGLERFLVTRMYDRGFPRQLPPLRVGSVTRPRPVAHHLVLPADDASIGYRTLRIHTFLPEDRRILGPERLAELDRQLHFRLAAQDRQEGGRFEPRNELSERTVAFLTDWLGKNPRGRRLLAFVAGKRLLYDLGEQLATKRGSAPPLRHPMLAGLLSEVEEPSHSACLRLAECSIFVHHSDLHREIRRAVEERCGAALAAKEPSQILLATETLSYGVNLAIDDVLLTGTRFPSSDRRRNPTHEALTPAEFHNMVGRCGRLGAIARDREANVWVMPASNVDIKSQILDLYYRRAHHLESRLFVDEDGEAVTAIDAKRGFGSQINPATLYTYPFARAVLDALRHTQQQQGGAGVTVGEIMELLGRTFYAVAHLHDDAYGTAAGYAEMFKGCVAQVLTGASQQDLHLVRVEGDRYHITARGEAVIDTGTEIATIQPLMATLRAVAGSWRGVVGPRPLPPYLYVLCLVAQREVCRRFVDATPEAHKRLWKHLSLDINERTQARVRSEFRSALETSVRAAWPEASAETLDDLAVALRGALEDSEQVRVIDAYQGAAVYPVLRLFNAAIAWIRGEPHRDVIRKITAIEGWPVGRPPPRGPTFSVSRFTEQMTWKTIFLARMLFASDATVIDELLLPADERSIHKLSLQFRFGCVPDAVPFFFGRGELPRQVAHRWLDRGLDPSTIAVISGAVAEAYGEVAPRTFEAAQRNVRRYALQSVEALGLEITAAKDRTVARLLAERVWMALVGTWWGPSVRAYDRGADPPPTVPADVAARLVEPVEGEEPVDNLARLVFREEVRTSGAVTWSIPSPRPGRPDTRLRVVPVQTRRVGLFSTGGEWVTAAQLLDAHEDAENLVVVPFPWLPPLSVEGVGASLAARHGTLGRRLTVLSPAAFATVLVSVARRFFTDTCEVLPLLGLPLGDEAPLALASGEIGFRWAGVWEVLSELDRRDAPVPRPVRIPMVQHFEPRPCFEAVHEDR